MGYYKLTTARNCSYADDIANCGYADLLDNYVCEEEDEDGNFVYADSINYAGRVEVATVVFMGAANLHDARAYSSFYNAYKDENGTLWVEEDDWNMHFC